MNKYKLNSREEFVAFKQERARPSFSTYNYLGEPKEYPCVAIAFSEVDDCDIEELYVDYVYPSDFN